MSLYPHLTVLRFANIYVDTLGRGHSLMAHLCTKWLQPRGREYCWGGLPETWTIGCPAVQRSQKHVACSGPSANNACLIIRWSLNRSQSLRCGQEGSRRAMATSPCCREWLRSSWESLEARRDSCRRVWSTASTLSLSLFLSCTAELAVPLLTGTSTE